MTRWRRWLIVVAVVALGLYLTSPVVEGGIYLTRPYVRLVSWETGVKGFGVCHDSTVGGYNYGRICD